MRIKTILILILILYLNISFAQIEKNRLLQLTDSILMGSDESKLKLNLELKEYIHQELLKSTLEIQKFDSNALFIELTDAQEKLQIISWAIQIDNKWEYWAFVKSYNEQKKEFVVWELISTDFYYSLKQKEKYDANNWPGTVYFKLIETKYNNRNYYTLLGWLANKKQAAFKIIEVLSISKSGKLSFGKSPYFSINKEYQNRLLFAYSAQSKFLLDYGEYDYTERIWDRKKKKYRSKTFSEYMITFDQLIPLYPDLKEDPAFLVPSGDMVDALVFEKGKWRKKTNIDARNLKKKTKKPNTAKLQLFNEE